MRRETERRLLSNMQDRVVAWITVGAEEIERSDWIWDRLWRFNQMAPEVKGIVASRMI